MDRAVVAVEASARAAKAGKGREAVNCLLTAPTSMAASDRTTEA